MAKQYERRSSDAVATMVEALVENLNNHMQREEANQKKFIEILADMKSTIGQLEMTITTDKLSAENQMTLCKTELKKELHDQAKADMRSLKLELNKKFDEQKVVLEQRRNDNKELYQRMDAVEKRQAVFGEYIDMLKKVLFTGITVIVIGVMAAIGLNK